MQKNCLEQLLPDDEAILLLDKSLLEVVKRYPKEKDSTYQLHVLASLDEIKNSQSI